MDLPVVEVGHQGAVVVASEAHRRMLKPACATDGYKEIAGLVTDAILRTAITS